MDLVKKEEVKMTSEPRLAIIDIRKAELFECKRRKVYK
jgi:hypothetical protein